MPSKLVICATSDRASQHGAVWDGSHPPKMMTLKTHPTQHPPRLTRLKRIQFHPFFHLGFCLHLGLAGATILTIGVADTLSHREPALAESVPETADGSETVDRPAPPATSPLPASSAPALTIGSASTDSTDASLVEALHHKALPSALAAVTFKPFADDYFNFYKDTPQQSTQVSESPTPLLPIQTGYVKNEPHQEPPKRLTAPTQAGVESLAGRSALLLADSGVPAPSDRVLKQGSSVLGAPSIQLQGVFKQEGSDTSARARVTTFYPVTPNAGFGAEVDLTTGRGFADSQETGLNLNELYFAGSLPSLPTLRFVVGLMDLTSYFDRNSFAKDGATHFFNSVFQTNPALAAAGIASRPGLLVNWSVTDDIDLKAATFSSTRDLGDFHLDAFAGEIGVRFGTAIIRGTYVSSRDAGQRSGFREIFDIPRVGRLGPQPGDREEAYGINGEVYIPKLKLGLFGRYGRYTNLALDASGTTYSAGLNFLDIFLPNDRLGLGYGRQLSNDDLRRNRGDNNPDVLELFYDFRITPNLRAAVMIQERNNFSDTVLGVRVRTDFDLSSVFRRSR